MNKFFVAAAFSFFMFLNQSTSFAEGFLTRYPLTEYYASLLTLQKIYPQEKSAFTDFVAHHLAESINASRLFVADEAKSVIKELNFISTNEQNRFLTEYVNENAKLFPQGVEGMGLKLVERVLLAEQVEEIVTREESAAPKNPAASVYKAQTSAGAKNYVDIDYLWRVESKEITKRSGKVSEAISDLKRFVERDLQQADGFEYKTLDLLHSVAYNMEQYYQYEGRTRVPLLVNEFIADILEVQKPITWLLSEKEARPFHFGLLLEGDSVSKLKVGLNSIIFQIAMVDQVFARNPGFVTDFGYFKEWEGIRTSLLDTLTALYLHDLSANDFKITGPGTLRSALRKHDLTAETIQYFVMSDENLLTKLSSSLAELEQLHKSVEAKIAHTRLQLFHQHLKDVNIAVFQSPENLKYFKRYGILPADPKPVEGVAVVPHSLVNDGPFKRDWNYLRSLTCKELLGLNQE